MGCWKISLFQSSSYPEFALTLHVLKLILLQLKSYLPKPQQTQPIWICFTVGQRSLLIAVHQRWINLNIFNYVSDFYTVHPTMWTRLTSWWFTTFMAPAIKHKLHNVYEVKELDSVINSTEFDIPMFIQEYDMSINGLRYYKP